MSLRRQIVRVKKLFFALTHPVCWKPLTLGVAPSIEHHQPLRGIDVDGIIDVGANRGQFAIECRLMKPGVPIVAFEPIPDAAKVFRKVHGSCRDVELIETALGDSQGKATLHLSRESDSSSILPIGDRQSALFPDTDEVGTLEVMVSRVDDYQDRWKNKQRLLLKIDVQGFELNVLRGSTETLRKCQYIYVECSEVELYNGQALRPAVNQFLSEHGFAESGRFNAHFDGTQLIQADYLFKKK